VKAAAVHSLAAMAIMAGVVTGVQAQAPYPNKAIRFIVAYAAGGANDVLARIVGQKLGEAWKQPVVIENKPGASGLIGADFVAKSAPDGYTLLSFSSGHAIASSLYSKPPFNALRDFAPITLVASMPLVLVVHPSVPAKSVRELVSLGKKLPMTYASSSTGTSSHLIGEMFKSGAGINVTHVPYKGGAQAVGDLLGGQVEMMFSNLSETLVYVKAAKLRALAVTADRRNPRLPDVPTMAQAGYPGFDAYTWISVVAPAGTPKDIVSKINGEIGRVLQNPEVKARLDDQGFDVATMGVEQFDAYMKSEIAKWAKLVKASGARAD